MSGSKGSGRVEQSHALIVKKIHARREEIRDQFRALEAEFYQLEKDEQDATRLLERYASTEVG